MRNDRDNLIVRLTFELDLDIVSFSEKIREQNRFEMASQIFRSGTSIGAKIREAQNAESKKDFIHKFKISAKEADELEYWLRLCESSEFYSSPNEKFLKDLKSVILIISKIISSSKNLNRLISKLAHYQIKRC